MQATSLHHFVYPSSNKKKAASTGDLLLKFRLFRLYYDEQGSFVFRLDGSMSIFERIRTIVDDYASFEMFFPA